MSSGNTTEIQSATEIRMSIIDEPLHLLASMLCQERQLELHVLLERCLLSAAHAETCRYQHQSPGARTSNANTEDDMAIIFVDAQLSA